MVRTRKISGRELPDKVIFETTTVRLEGRPTKLEMDHENKRIHFVDEQTLKRFKYSVPRDILLSNYKIDKVDILHDNLTKAVYMVDENYNEVRSEKKEEEIIYDEEDFQ